MQLSLHDYSTRWLCLFSVSLVVAGITLVQSVRSADASELRRTAIVTAVEKARPSVVNIHGRKIVRNQDAPFGSTGDNKRLVNGMGTGVVIDPRGYIITNYHVVQGVSQIQVTLANHKTFTARLIRHDPKTDLAIIKISTDQKLPVITIGTSSDLMPGEPVIAMGNAYGYEHTVTRGIISALHRTVPINDDQKYENLIQTDASINPGNSGGPLLNIDGEMIAINVAVRIGAQGIGFAIPVDEAMKAAAMLLSAERLEGISHGVIGETLTDEMPSKFIVRSVTLESPAANGGLQPGDIITEVDGQTISRALDFERAFLGRQPGEEIEFHIQRDGELLTKSLVVADSSGSRQSVSNTRSWRELGLKLEPIEDQVFRRYRSRYRGGLKVSAVRSDSPAAEQGVQPGDVLVGMHIWETISPENITYILNRSDFVELQPIKFYILRSGETLYGHMEVSARSTR